SLSRTPADGR
nr:Chain B, Ubiquitin carboxyl-terminal hydrolase 25 [Homo sapiens]